MSCFVDVHFKLLVYWYRLVPLQSMPRHWLFPQDFFLLCLPAWETSHSRYRWKPELVGLTTPVLMESEDAVLPLPMCHALPLIGTSEPVKRTRNSRTWVGRGVFKEEFLARDGDMLANMKIEADNVGQRWGGIFNVAWPSPNRPPDPGDRAAVYAVIPTGNGGQEGLQLPHVVLWAQRVLQGLSTKYLALFLVKVGYVRATSDQPQLWHWDLPLELQTVGVEHAFSCFMAVNLDCPMDGRENMFVYGSSSVVPYPWQEVSPSMLAGDLCILSSYVIPAPLVEPAGVPQAPPTPVPPAVPHGELQHASHVPEQHPLRGVPRETTAAGRPSTHAVPTQVATAPPVATGGMPQARVTFVPQRRRKECAQSHRRL